MNPITKIANTDVKRNLDIAWLNQQKIANNLANANTKGYKGTHVVPIQLPPEQSMSLDKTNSTHLSLQSSASLGYKTVPVTDLNLDSEMTEMTKNNLFYQTLLETVARQDHMAKSVMEGR